jgi:hypothetical protein
MRRPLAGWETWVAAIAGGVAIVAMPARFYAPAVSDLVTILGFLVAAFVPAMVLAATTLRAGGFSVHRIEALGVAIRKQIRLFGGLFFYALAACAILVAGKIVEWRLPIISLPRAGISIDFSFAFPAALTFMLVFLALRSFAFLDGVGSLLNITVEIAKDEARARDKNVEAKGEAELEEYQLPKEYGAQVEELTAKGGARR